MEDRDLYELCCDCKFAKRHKTGVPTSCLLKPPRIDDTTCHDFTPWHFKYAPKPPSKAKEVVTTAGVLLIVPAVLAWFLRLFLPKGISPDMYLPKLNNIREFYLGKPRRK